MDDFIRINAPRVDRIAGIVGQIDKSARSQRPSDDVKAELARLMGRAVGDWAETMEAPASAPIPVTPDRPGNPVAVAHTIHQMDEACFKAAVAAVMARLTDG